MSLVVRSQSATTLSLLLLSLRSSAVVFSIMSFQRQRGRRDKNDNNGSAAASSTSRSTTTSSSSSGSSSSAIPSLFVFDLDDCLWTPEMHELYGEPIVPVHGPLVPSDDVGVVGLRVPRGGRDQTVTLYDGARRVLYELATNPAYRDTPIAVASTSLEPSYSHRCLEELEITKGTTLADMVSFRQIGRSGRLTSDKRSHFRLLHLESGVPYGEMLFFDDCNWGDHCGVVSREFGVVSHRTPSGLTVRDFERGMAKYRESRAPPPSSDPSSGGDNGIGGECEAKERK